jgi:hypothetical protein
VTGSGAGGWGSRQIGLRLSVEIGSVSSLDASGCRLVEPVALEVMVVRLGNGFQRTLSARACCAA